MITLGLKELQNSSHPYLKIQKKQLAQPILVNYIKLKNIYYCKTYTKKH